VITGNISVACVGGTPDCSTTTSGDYGILEVNPPGNSLPAWTTTAGYDLATGLGSVNAGNLVRNWTSVSFNPTTTKLANLSPTTLTHGQPVGFTVNVAHGSGSSTPTGNVSLIAQTGGSASNATGIGPFTLSGGSVTTSTDMLPGGTYGVTAHYAGNGTYGASDSTPPVQVTVSPEGSQTHVAFLTFNLTTGRETSTNATTAPYGSLAIARADVTNSSGQECFSAPPYACPSGQVTLTDNGQPLDAGTYKLNSQGYTEDQMPVLPVGSHSLVASYSGDNSYNASASATDTLSVTQAPTTTTISGFPSVVQGGTVDTNFTVTVSTESLGVAPSGNLQVLDGAKTLGVGGDFLGTNGSASAPASMTAILTTSLQPGAAQSITAQYAGDGNYLASTSAPVMVTVTDFSVSANPATVNIAAPGKSGTATITITPLYGFIGSVTLTCYSDPSAGFSCSVSPSSVAFSGSSPVTATLTITTTAKASLTAPSRQPRCPPSSGLPFGWPWILAWLLGSAALASLARVRRRPVILLLASALLMAGIWVSCGGGGGGSTPPPSAPIVSLSPASLSFGQETMGITSAPQTVTVSNTGNASLDFTSEALSGANSGDFAQTTNCPLVLAAGGSCPINITFTPSASGTRTASLAVSDNASGSPQQVSLTGTGMAPSVTLSPATVNFGQEDVSATSAPKTVTLSNNGNSSLGIASIALGGGYPQDFGESNNCGNSVAAGGNCTIGVTFTPGIVGPFSAALIVTDNSSNSPQMTNLTGTGVQPTPPGSYTIQIGAQSGYDQHVLNVSVVVQ
jgi:hypothetical protein